MSIYVTLADRINDVFSLGLKSHQEDSAFVKIFREILTEKEARFVCFLSDKLETVEELSLKIGEKEDKLQQIFSKSAEKGIIFEQEGKYKLMPFVPGIFEALLYISTDIKIAAYLEQYSKEMKRIKENGREKIIPMNCKIETKVQHVTMDEIRLYLEKSEQHAVMDCICRTVRKANGKACGHTIKDMCILIGDYVDYYVKSGNARIATKEEILKILVSAEEEGLFHEMYPVEKSSSVFICNCCTCGCMFLELSERIKKVLKYGNKVRIEQGKCDQCGKCLDACPQQVFQWNGKKEIVVMEEEKCMHCGLCEIVCVEGAIVIEE